MRPSSAVWFPDQLPHPSARPQPSKRGCIPSSLPTYRAPLPFAHALFHCIPLMLSDCFRGDVLRRIMSEYWNIDRSRRLLFCSESGVEGVQEGDRGFDPHQGLQSDHCPPGMARQRHLRQGEDLRCAYYCYSTICYVIELCVTPQASPVRAFSSFFFSPTVESGGMLEISLAIMLQAHRNHIVVLTF